MTVKTNGNIFKLKIKKICLQVAPGSLYPNASKHETVFVIEPQSGIPISVKARFQVNVLVDQMSDVDLFKHVPSRTFFPVIWFESRFDLADSLVGQMWILSHLKIGMFVGGLLMVSFLKTFFGGLRIAVACANFSCA